MKTKQLIEASADVLTIATLKRGDVYKRVIAASNFESSRIQFGIVTSVMHNGEEGAVTAIEYGVDYSGVNTKQVVFTTDNQDVAIFPATVEEAQTHFADLRSAMDRKVRDAETALDKAREQRSLADDVLSTVPHMTEAEVVSPAPTGA